MVKKGFKPKWTPLHDERADAFQKIYFAEGKREVVSDQEDFMKWAYGKKA